MTLNELQQPIHESTTHKCTRKAPEADTMETIHTFTSTVSSCVRFCSNVNTMLTIQNRKVLLSKNTLPLAGVGVGGGAEEDINNMFYRNN